MRLLRPASVSLRADGYHRQQLPFCQKMRVTTFTLAGAVLWAAFGTGQVLPEANGTTVANPNWSPDGERIAFTGNRYGPYGIFLMRLDDRSVRPVLLPGLMPRWPSWSPDGTRLAFAAGTEEAPNSLDIYLARPDGTELVRVTHASVHGGLVAWSRDGRQLAYYSSDAGHSNIYTVSIDGTNTRMVTDNAADHYVPSWSPDGNLLLMGANRNGDQDIFTLDLMQYKWNQLTATAQNESAPRWSPDGTWISFEADGDGDWEIYLMRVETGEVTQLTHNDSFDAMTTWSPDATKLAYECREEKVQHICVSDLSSQDRRVLTTKNR